MPTNNALWWTKSINPNPGCSKVSDACQNCYALNFAWRHAHNPKTKDRYEGLVEKKKGIINWTGKTNWIPSELAKVAHWNKPQQIFVNDMGDTFHPDNDLTQIAAIYGTALACPDHTFMLLTKRPWRAVEFFEWLDKAAKKGMPDTVRFAGLCATIAQRTVDGISLQLMAQTIIGGLANRKEEWDGWPPKNLWLGVTIENRKHLLERWNCLVKAPAAVYFISGEPLLGPLDISICDPIPSWVITGGETGPGARPMHPYWARRVRDDCAAAGVPFFFKQHGEWYPTRPEDKKPFGELKCKEWNGGNCAWRVGKKRAGRLLDGVEHNEYPT